MPKITPKVPMARGRIQGYNRTYDCKMVDTPIIEGTFRLVDYSRGRSSVKLHVESIDGAQRYEMFITDFMTVAKDHGWPLTGVNGKWSFCKRGQNYGFFLIEHSPN